MHDDTELKRNLFRVRLRNAMYPIIAVAMICLALLYVIDNWHRVAGLSFWGVVLGFVSGVLLCYWLHIDRSEDLENCPTWLRRAILWTGTLALVLFIGGMIA